MLQQILTRVSCSLLRFGISGPDMTAMCASRQQMVATRLFVLIAVCAWTPSTLAAATYVGGNISVNTTWTLAGSPYIAQSPVLVASGATLTIEPGVVVKVSGELGKIVVFAGGTLNAIGTAESRIILTSLQDDSIAGDSGGDGPTAGAPGQWYTLSIKGTALLQYVDVRYGGNGSSIVTYEGISVASGGAADLDHCALYYNETSGITVAANSSATIAHSQLFQNAVGASALNAVLTIQANSSLSSNTHTGLFLNMTDSFTDVAASVMNADIANNGEYGVRLQVSSALQLASMPFGHENNIFNNKAGAAQRQLTILQPLVESSWTDNYWGPVAEAIPCPWAPPQTTGMHLSPVSAPSYCEDPPDGPTKNYTYVLPGCPDNKPMKCRADWVDNVPYAANPIDNSNK